MSGYGIMKREQISRGANAAMLALGIAETATQVLAAPGDSEKCDGIAKADRSDCGLSKTSWAALAKGGHDAEPWTLVPMGTCKKNLNKSRMCAKAALACERFVQGWQVAREQATNGSVAGWQAPVAQCQAAGEPPLGAHLVTQRRGYSHHGIYVGNGRVLHYAGLCRGLHTGPVEELSLEHFGAGNDIEVRTELLPRFTSDEVVRRARSRLGENRYRLLSNNCEHFCTWCLYGEARSEQVRQCAIHPMRILRVLSSLLSVWWNSRPAHALLAAGLNDRSFPRA